MELDKLPPVLTAGVTAENWEERRRGLVDVLAREEYGTVPPPLAGEVCVLSCRRSFAGKGMFESLRFDFSAEGERFSFPATLIYPAGGQKFPFFVLANFTSAVPDKYFPAEEVIDGGFGVISFGYNDVSADEDRFGEGAEKLFFREGDEGRCGKLSLWAWAMSRLLDYVFARGLADGEKTAAIGHSRLGKAALWAAANDVRFRYVFSNNSGCSGAALSRGKKGETLDFITRMFPHWFCKKYPSYAGREWEMPFDQHFLIAATAPRTVAVGAAAEDDWADSYSQYMACKGAEGAYRLFGMGGGFFDDAPKTGKAYGRKGLFFREREGTHCLSRADWQYYMRILRR